MPKVQRKLPLVEEVLSNSAASSSSISTQDSSEPFVYHYNQPASYLSIYGSLLVRNIGGCSNYLRDGRDLSWF